MCPSDRASFEPRAGTAGTVLTISGPVDDVSDVRIAGVLAPVLRRAPGVLRVLVMPPTRSGPIALSAAGNSVALEPDFIRLEAPVRPLKAVSTLRPRDGSGAAEFGTDVALSADGTTLAVGGYQDAKGAGAAWVWRRGADGAWAQQGDKLFDGDAGALARCQGFSVALDALGETLAVGAPSSTGAALAYGRQADGQWLRVGPPLVGWGVANGYEAAAVALTADGRTLLSVVNHSPGPSKNVTGWVFSRPGAQWLTPGVALQTAGPDDDGIAGGLTAMGDLAVLSAGNYAAGTGSAWVFAGGPSMWGGDAGVLTGTSPTPARNFRVATSVSGDGSTVVVLGATPAGGAHAGTAWVFGRASDGTWAQQGPRLDVPELRFVWRRLALAVGFSGDRFVVAGTSTAGDSSALVQYVRDAGTWAAPDGPVHFGNGGVATSVGVASVAVSLDGRTVVAGSPADDGSQGAVWVFTADP